MSLQSTAFTQLPWTEKKGAVIEESYISQSSTPSIQRENSPTPLAEFSQIITPEIHNARTPSEFSPTHITPVPVVAEHPQPVRIPEAVKSSNSSIFALSPPVEATPLFSPPPNGVGQTQPAEATEMAAEPCPYGLE
jgi:hypothetical protein